MAKNKRLVTVRFPEMMWAKLAVMASAYNTSSTWIALDTIRKAQETSALRKTIIEAARHVQAQDATNGFAKLVLSEESNPVVTEEVTPSAPAAKAQPIVAKPVSAAPQDVQSASPVQQPVFDLDSLAPVNDLSLPAVSSAPENSTTPRIGLVATPVAETLDPDDWAERARNRALVNP